MNLVGWDRVALPKRLGGLGLRKSRDHNVALLGKQVWQIYTGADKPWVHLLQANYFPNGAFLGMEDKNGSPVWKAFQKAKNILKDGFEFKIGDSGSSF